MQQNDLPLLFISRNKILGIVCSHSGNEANEWHPSKRFPHASNHSSNSTLSYNAEKRVSFKFVLIKVN